MEQGTQKCPTLKPRRHGAATVIFMISKVTASTICYIMTTGHEKIIKTNTMQGWANAERRTAILGRLAAEPRCSRAAARQAAAELGISERQVFALVRRLRGGKW